MRRSLSVLRRSPLPPTLQPPGRPLSSDTVAHPNRPPFEQNAGPRSPRSDSTLKSASPSNTPSALESQHQTPDFKRLSTHELSPHSRIPSRAEDYNFSKARLHSSLWRSEVQKHFGLTSPEAGGLDSLSVGDGIQQTGVALSDDWESFVRPGEILNEETAIKEENMLVEEFERRKEHNRVQVAKFVKQHLYARRRPVDGWKYIVNSFGVTKGAKVSAFQLDENRASELEKLALKKEHKNRRRT